MKPAGSPLVVVRTDASPLIGSGHLMRCLTLADALGERSAHVEFICREHDPAMLKEVERRGYRLHRLPAPQGRTLGSPDSYESWLGVTQETDARQIVDLLHEEQIRPDWLIADHYALDRTWERVLRSEVQQIMVIDDLANRHHDCDLLLDQNLYDGFETRYDDLIPKSSQRLLGPSFALLRLEFAEARKRLRKRDGRIQQVLVFLGGADLPNMTGLTLEAIDRPAFAGLTFHIVLGVSNPHQEAVILRAKTIPNVKIYSSGQSMAELMSEADLAIGAAGTTTWERCCLGLPSILMVLADNQAEIAENADKQGIAISLGEYQSVTRDMIAQAIERCMKDQTLMQEMSRQCLSIVDGHGAARVTEQMIAAIAESAR